MLLRSTLIAAGLTLAVATAASAQVFVGPGPFYGSPFYGPRFYGPPVVVAPAPVVVAPRGYYGWGPRPGPFYDVDVVTGPG